MDDPTYVLDRTIARGGTATVHLARMTATTGFARIVAVKKLHPPLARDPAIKRRLLDEARVAARIHHVNVVPTVDVRVDGGEILLVMEYVHGESLARLVEAARTRREGIDERIAVGIAVAILRGLSAAHETVDEAGRKLGVVHRDVSPQNVLVGADGVARVVDFGIAKALSASESTATREGLVQGKLRYMAPEQLRRKPATEASDVYATAVILWELLSGVPLFTSENQLELMEEVLVGMIDPPSTTAPQVTVELDEIVLRGLDGDPKRRYPSAAAMADALEACLEPAPAVAIGAWVETLAEERLASLAEDVARLESGIANSTSSSQRDDPAAVATTEGTDLAPTVQSARLPPPPPPPTALPSSRGQSTEVMDLAPTLPIPARSRESATSRAVPFVVGGVVLVLAALVGTSWRLRATEEGPAPAPEKATTPGQLSSPPPPVAASPSEPSTEEPSAAPSASSVSSAFSATPRATAAASRAAPKARRDPPKEDCSTYDPVQRIVKYDPECLRRHAR